MLALFTYCYFDMELVFLKWNCYVVIGVEMEII